MTLKTDILTLADQKLAKETIIDVFMRRINNPEIVPEELKAKYQHIFNIIGSGEATTKTLNTVLQLMENEPKLQLAALLISSDIEDLLGDWLKK